MSSHKKILDYVATCDNAVDLRQIIANAKGKPDAAPLAEAAFRRLIELVPGEEPGTLAFDFWRTIFAFEQMLTEERGKTTRLARTRQKLARAGVVETLRGFAEGPPTAGFKMLIERSMPELTGEALIIKHGHLFEPGTIAAARTRLHDVGYEVGSTAP
jgi:hypothetical protein